jgi:polysaccharide export outer membrane protein
LVELLRKYIRVPQVTVTVTQYSAEPVFFVGAFKSPGIYPLQGRHTLVEMMSSLGGMLPTASRRIKVTRRKEYGVIPLPAARVTADEAGSVVEINMASLRDNVNPAEDIVLQPFDVVSVERAEMVYVGGEVGKTGAFELQERDSISVIQVLTLAGGLSSGADAKNARILRPISGTSRRAAIPLDVESILRGKESDRPLLPNDLLYVPKSGALSKNMGRTLLILVPIVTSVISVIALSTR